MYIPVVHINGRSIKNWDHYGYEKPEDENDNNGNTFLGLDLIHSLEKKQLTNVFDLFGM